VVEVQIVAEVRLLEVAAEIGGMEVPMLAAAILRKGGRVEQRGKRVVVSDKEIQVLSSAMVCFGQMNPVPTIMGAETETIRYVLTMVLVILVGILGAIMLVIIAEDSIMGITMEGMMLTGVLITLAVYQLESNS
jgi:hypothetical protein